MFNGPFQAVKCYDLTPTMFLVPRVGWWVTLGAEIMDLRNTWTENEEDEAEPMLAVQFQIAVKKTVIQNPRTVEAAKLVLVEKRRVSEVAKESGLDDAYLRRSVKKIQEKFQEICDAEGWEYLPIALPRASMKLVLEMQDEKLREYDAQVKTGVKRRKKKK